MPSEVMGIENEYVAFCFNEACMYIQSNLQKKHGPRPKWKKLHQPSKPINNSDTINKLLNYM